jgi:hypothetical protein
MFVTVRASMESVCEWGGRGCTGGRSCEPPDLTGVPGQSGWMVGQWQPQVGRQQAAAGRPRLPLAYAAPDCSCVTAWVFFWFNTPRPSSCC